jgi:hypothetical protein
MIDNKRVALAVKCLLIAVKRFYYSDNIVFEKFCRKNKGMERACAFRIGSYYREMIEDKETSSFYGYNVDMEYNRQGEKGNSKISEGKIIFPDLLLHRRGSNDNILICEFKMQNDEKGDFKKLAQMTQQKGGKFSYSIGIFFRLEKQIECCEIVFFCDGKQIPIADFYKRYHITKNEQVFIESLIKPMEVEEK